MDADAEEFLNELNLLSDGPVVYTGIVTTNSVYLLKVIGDKLR